MQSPLKSRYSPVACSRFFLDLPLVLATGESERLLFDLAFVWPVALSAPRRRSCGSPARDWERDREEETAEDAADDLPRCRRGRRERLETVVGAGKGGERVRSTGVARVLELASDMGP